MADAGGLDLDRHLARARADRPRCRRRRRACRRRCCGAAQRASCALRTCRWCGRTRPCPTVVYSDAPSDLELQHVPVFVGSPTMAMSGFYEYGRGRARLRRGRRSGRQRAHRRRAARPGEPVRPPAPGARAARRATPSPRVLPNGRRCSRCTWRHCRPACTSRRSTTTSSAPRSPTSCRTATRRRSSSDERFAEAIAAAADEVDFPADGRFALGDGRPGSGRYAELGAGQPDTLARRPHRRRAMHYTSGTTGKPKGVQAASSPTSTPTTWPSCSPASSAVRHPAAATTTCTSRGSPHYHTAVLHVDGQRPHLGPPGRAHGQVDARGDARS